MRVDYHVHTPYCGHAHGKIIHYIDSAIENGIQEIGFADHLGRYYLTPAQKRRYWDWGMDERELVRYYAELSDLREIYSDRIAVKIGLEIDYIEGAEDLLAPFFDNFSLDFCLCSIHCIPRFGWKHLSDYHSNTDNSEVYKEYFRLSRAALKSGLFHSLAHLDFIWRYLNWPVNEHEEMLSEISRTVQTALQSDRCIEINANGFIFSKANRNQDFDPFDFLIDQISQYNAPITTGSDAHDPKMVAKAFPEMINFLLSKGITSFRSFSDGNPSSNSLYP